jgi:hypothetical protein
MVLETPSTCESLMTHSQQLRNRHPRNRFAVISCTLGCLLMMVPSALAGYDPGSPSSPATSTGTTGTRAYNPPPNPSRPSGPTGSSGTRGGCEASGDTSLTPLAPVSHVGRTTAIRPTFAWFVPEAKAYPVKFYLYEYSNEGKGDLIEQIDLQSKPGIMQLQLPETSPELKVGQKYSWQVALICKANRPSADLIAEAVVEVAAMPDSLKSTLAKTTDTLKRSQLYAQAGFWYDAMAETLKDAKAKPFQLNLLNELAQLETSANPSNPNTQGEQLKQVLTIEQKTK